MIYYFFAILLGMWTSLMLTVNGQLTKVYQPFFATVIIHVVGLVAIVILTTLRKQWRMPKEKLPFYYFCGGVIGVVTTVGGNLAFGLIGVSTVMALGLLGQTVTASIIDQFGFLGMPRRRINPLKFVGLAIIALGIAVMIIWG